MASSYTTNTGIEKPATGEQSGTWGDTTNTNFDIIDRLTHGVGTISLSGTTHTLTTSDGALSEGQFTALVLGGSPSGTNTITISPNDQTKLFIVKNSSGQDAIFTQGSGGNVTVSNGTSKIITADGAGSGAEVVDITNTIDLAGVVNATTFKIDGTEVTSTAAELNLLDGVSAGTIANSKGVIYGSSGEVNATTLQVGGTSITATPAELNLMDGVTATTAEINFLDGVTSNIQTQIDNLDQTPAGIVSPFAGSSAPSGWLLCHGQAVSRTTYATLLSAIGTTYGVGDGSSTFNLPDVRGRVVAGKDNMGGSSADRLTGQSGGIDGDGLGNTGGSETHTLTLSEIPSHTHNYNNLTTDVRGTNQGGGTAFENPQSVATTSAGSDAPHNNVQPSIIFNYIIKT